MAGIPRANANIVKRGMGAWPQEALPATLIGFVYPDSSPEHPGCDVEEE